MKYSEYALHPSTFPCAQPDCRACVLRRALIALVAEHLDPIEQQALQTPGPGEEKDTLMHVSGVALDVAMSIFAWVPGRVEDVPIVRADDAPPLPKCKCGADATCYVSGEVPPDVTCNHSTRATQAMCDECKIDPDVLDPIFDRKGELEYEPIERTLPMTKTDDLWTIDMFMEAVKMGLARMTNGRAVVKANSIATDGPRIIKPGEGRFGRH